MLNTPTRVLLVRDWTIFFETVCMAAGKSFKRGAENNEPWTFQFNHAAAAHVYLDAGVYGTNEEDVRKDDEDTDVDSQHDRGAAGNTGTRSSEHFGCFHKWSAR